MTGARQVLIEVDDLEELLDLVERGDHAADVEHPGFVEHKPILDEGERRLVERVRREVLGR